MPAMACRAPFRQALSERGLTWAVGIPGKPEGLPGRRRADLPRRRPRPPAQAPRPRRDVGHRARRCWTTARLADAELAARHQGRLSRRASPRARAGRRRPAAAHRRHGRTSTCRARRSGWSASIARPASASTTSPTCPPTRRSRRLAGAIKARWVCEQAHQQLKEELGLDHFEGRSWTGLHRHALMTMIAFAFLQSRRLKQAKREKKKPRPAASAEPAGDPARHHRRPRTATTNPMSALPHRSAISLKICQSCASCSGLSRASTT